MKKKEEVKEAIVKNKWQGLPCSAEDIEKGKKVFIEIEDCISFCMKKRKKK